MKESIESEPLTKKTKIIIGSIVIIIGVIVLLIYLLSPSFSPIPSIRDTDGDGVADSADAFPYISSQWSDQDDDGYGDNPSGAFADTFPNNPSEWIDTDSDGVGDNGDAFPSDPYEQKDTDSDGMGDKSDIYDSGDGHIKISIDSYQGDGYGDPDGSLSDPFFIIDVDENLDSGYYLGSWNGFELQKQSQVFTNNESLVSPFHAIFDIPDNATTIKFMIEVFDKNVVTESWIDYNPAAGGSQFFMVIAQTVNVPFSHTWTYNGADDLRNERDCELTYSISLVGG